jgi:hypothetical protein
MAYEVVPESSEELALKIKLNLSTKAQPFYFAVTNRAIYIPRIKLIAKSDPFYFQRVSLDQVRHVAVKRLRPYGLWLLAAVMVVVGLLTTFWMMEGILGNGSETRHVSGWPIAIFVCGFLVPFAAKDRFGLEIWFEGGRYHWKPPLVVDRMSKQRIAGTLQIIIDACARVGVPIAENPED